MATDTQATQSQSYTLKYGNFTTDFFNKGSKAMVHVPCDSYGEYDRCGKCKIFSYQTYHHGKYTIPLASWLPDNGWSNVYLYLPMMCLTDYALYKRPSSD